MPPTLGACDGKRVLRRTKEEEEKKGRRTVGSGEGTIVLYFPAPPPTHKANQLQRSLLRPCAGGLVLEGALARDVGALLGVCP